MLSTESAQVVKATLPAIGAAIGDITPVFHKRMFAGHPELERDLFNRGNQAQGDQQSALAGAVAAYATLLGCCVRPLTRSSRAGVIKDRAVY